VTPSNPSRPIRTVLIAGLAAGVFDITAACGFYGLRGVSPVRILQSIASGLLGAAAFTGGAPTAILGLCLHFVIATTAAAVYHSVSRRLTFLVRHAVVSGASFGVAVYLFMHHVVLPLSAVNKRPFSLSTAIAMVIIHIVCVGLPIALTVRHYSEEPEVEV
jgi:uncharacterized membrane protein YagU involved in acid resistance